MKFAELMQSALGTALVALMILASISAYLSTRLGATARVRAWLRAVSIVTNVACLVFFVWALAIARDN
ncbi:MAG: hypothetical protein R3E65_02815 [Steroidobacteraceae bacterium]